MRLKQLLLGGFFAITILLIATVSYFVSISDHPSTVKAYWRQCNCVGNKFVGEDCPKIIKLISCKENDK